MLFFIVVYDHYVFCIGSLSRGIWYSIKRVCSEAERGQVSMVSSTCVTFVCISFA